MAAVEKLTVPVIRYDNSLCLFELVFLQCKMTVWDLGDREWKREDEQTKMEVAGG